MKNNRPNYTMRMYFMYRDAICTIIDIDFEHRNVIIENKTDQIMLRAFGVIENPSWIDFNYFLEYRCVPRTRTNIDDLLEEMDVPYYDPILIIRKTQGRITDDAHWIKIVEDEELINENN